jgi:hypothetical protein
MGYVIVIRFGKGQVERTPLPEDARLDEAKESALSCLKKLASDGISAQAAEIENGQSVVVSSLTLSNLTAMEYLNLLEGGYLAAWS